MSILPSGAANAGLLSLKNLARLTALSCSVTGQKQPIATRPAAVKATATAPKLTPQQERGLRLLKAAEAESAGLEPDMRAFVLWRASYAYLPVDQKRADQLAEESFNASQTIEHRDDDQCGAIGSAGDIQSWIQERVLDELIRKDKIPEVERLLPAANEKVRDLAAQLVRYYVAKKEFSRALDILSQFADAAEYPFAAGGFLVGSRAGQKRRSHDNFQPGAK